MSLVISAHKAMLRTLGFAASSRTTRFPTGNIPQIPLRTLQDQRHMSSRFFSLARFGFPWQKAGAPQTSITPKAVPVDVPIDEEIIPGYDPKHFYHPNPGDILHHRYKLKAKIGWGTSSTVWLAQDLWR